MIINTINTAFLPWNSPPLLPLTISLIMGIIWQSCGYPLYYTGIITLLISFITYWHCKQYAQWLFVLIGPLFLTGAFLYQKQQTDYANLHAQLIKNPLTATVTITDIAKMDHERFKYHVTGIINHATINNHPVNDSINKIIMIHTNTNPSFFVGDQISLPPLTIKEPSNSSLKNYFIKENILTYSTIHPFTYKLIERPYHSFWRWIFEQKQKIFLNLKEKMSPTTFTFFSAIFLGNRKINKFEYATLKQYCKYWGISHYLARSGLHLVMIIASWHMALRYIPLYLPYKHILIIILIALYSILSWSSISFYRALLTFIITSIMVIGNQQRNTLHIVILVTFLTLLHNPMNLFFLDFQLSFGITFFLTWFNHINSHRKLKH